MTNLQADTKLAIDLEKKGYEFYRSAAAQTSNRLAASTLTGLAEREMVHIQRIMEFYQNLSGEKTISSDWLARVETPPTKAELIKPILDHLRDGLNRKFETSDDIKKAYLAAEGLERDSYTLYDKIAKENQQDELTFKFYSALAAEEKDHYSILEDTLLYLENPGEWFHRQEHWIVEGG
jgi:rubrerythrin